MPAAAAVAGLVLHALDRDPPPFESERKAQWGIRSIHAGAAHARGLTGKGATVAVIDSGLDTSHPDLAGRIAPGGINFLVDQAADDVSDRDGHGTHVSGIIAANRDATGMHGVAYGARILPIRLIDDVEGNTTENLVAAVRHAVAADARVINGSYGPVFDEGTLSHPLTGDDSREAEAYIEAARADVVMVFAAGNEGLFLPVLSAHPTGASLYPYVRPEHALTEIYDDAGAGYDFSELNGNLLTVVAVDRNNLITEWSNHCGVAADWCLAAPGSRIVSTLPVDQGSYGPISGTSMAAPHVSGAVALLDELFPHLSGAQITEILLTTATDIGPESIYGQGLLNLDAATRPIGTATIPTAATVEGAGSLLAESRIVLGAPFGDALGGNGPGLAFVDAYDRAYRLKLNALISRDPEPFALAEAVTAFASAGGLEHVDLGGGTSLAFTAPPGDVRQAGAPALPAPQSGGRGAVSLTRKLSERAAISLNYNMGLRRAFGIFGSGALRAGDPVHPGALGTPYLGFAELGPNAHYTARLGEALTWRLGGFTGTAEEADGNIASSGAMSELRLALPAQATIGLQLGGLVEEDSFLGSTAKGAFATERGIPTWFIGLTGRIELGGQMTLFGSVHRGQSRPAPAPGSLFEALGAIRSEAYSVGALRSDLFRPADRLGVAVSQPLRVRGGSASLLLPVARDLAGNVRRERHAVDLAPEGREIVAQAFYHAPLGRRTRVGAGVYYRHEPGHVRGDEPEIGAMLRLSHRF